jgi:hypothetical protein
LYQIYKLALTLPVTQVFCERTFSKLLKTWLRSTLSGDHLESLLLIMVENKLLDSFSMDNIIDNVAEHSSEYQRLLLRWSINCKLYMICDMILNNTKFSNL